MKDGEDDLAPFDEGLKRFRDPPPDDPDKYFREHDEETGPQDDPAPNGAGLPLGACEPTEDGIALAFAQRYCGRFVHDHERGAWFYWDDETGLWRRDTTNYVPDTARAFVRGVRQALDKPPASLTRERIWRAIERTARDDRRLAVDHSAWNADPLMVGVKGGAIDLRTGDLLPADPHHMLNLAAAVRPAPPGTPHPLWSRFLDEATREDLELQRFLAQRAGYWLSGDVSQESFDFIFGPGGNGKGVFLKTLTAISGDYSIAAPIGMFMTSKHDGHPTELARLVDARLVVASETEERRTWATAKIKALTGNETRIPARFMGRDFFEYWPRFKLVFVGNHRPRIATVDDALARRLNLIPFTFKPDRPDPDLKAKLVVEYPAILRWAIEGWLDLQADGPRRPAVIAAATQDYLEEEDTIGGWLAERCNRGPSFTDQLKALFSDWEGWCQANHEDAGSSRNLKKQLEKLEGVTFDRRNTGIWVVGLCRKARDDSRYGGGE